MAMAMYLFTCGFVCDNSNVYSTCNTHTNSKYMTHNNEYTSKHDTGINVHDSHCFASSSAFINHSLNPAQRLLCGGTQRRNRRAQQSVCTLAHSTWHTVRGPCHRSQ